LGEKDYICFEIIASFYICGFVGGCHPTPTVP
jgi:hypothetical protein